MTYLPSIGHHLPKAPPPSNCLHQLGTKPSAHGPLGSIQNPRPVPPTPRVYAVATASLASPLCSPKLVPSALDLKPLAAISMSIEAHGTPPFSDLHSTPTSYTPSNPHLTAHVRPQPVLSCGFLVSDFQSESEATFSAAAAASSPGKFLSKETDLSVSLQVSVSNARKTSQFPLPPGSLSYAVLASLELTMCVRLAYMVSSRPARVIW